MADKKYDAMRMTMAASQDWGSDQYQEQEQKEEGNEDALEVDL